MPYSPTGTLKGSKFKFCKKCRHDQRLIDRLRCVKCCNPFDPIIMDEGGCPVGSIFKLYCAECAHENCKARSMKQHYKLSEDPNYSIKRNKLAKLRRLQKQGRLPKDMEIVA